MKVAMTKNLFLILFCITACFISVTSCAGKMNNQNSNSDVGMIKPYQNNWSVRIILNNPGTRSEGRTFSLYYKKVLIPYVFETIYAGGQGFRFRKKINLWDSAGYVPADDVMIELAQETITAAELSQGWYNSSAWKKNTPPHWCLVTRDAISAVVDPLKLKDFISQHQWKEYSLYNIELPVQP